MPNSGAKRLGLALDADALERAEAALKNLASEFDGWMQDEIARIGAARAQARAAAYDETSLTALHRCAHDIKGLGATYDYPLATDIAASLCRLVDTPAGRARAKSRPIVVEAHVDAIRAIFSAQIRTADHPVARELLAELGRQVAALTAVEG
jgi:chemotaxis protein histidine kinase CheA